MGTQLNQIHKMTWGSKTEHEAHRKRTTEIQRHRHKDMKEPKERERGRESERDTKRKRYRDREMERETEGQRGERSTRQEPRTITRLIGTR